MPGSSTQPPFSGPGRDPLTRETVTEEEPEEKEETEKSEKPPPSQEESSEVKSDDKKEVGDELTVELPTKETKKISNGWSKLFIIFY